MKSRSEPSVGQVARPLPPAPKPETFVVQHGKTFCHFWIFRAEPDRKAGNQFCAVMGRLTHFGCSQRSCFRVSTRLRKEVVSRSVKLVAAGFQGKVHQAPAVRQYSAGRRSS